MRGMDPDAVAALLLDEAGPLSGRVAVVDDSDGALTRAAAAQGAEVLTWCDDLRALADVPAEHRTPWPPPPGFVPDVVLWRLPKAVSAVEDYAEHLAALVGPHTRILAGARTRHMTPAQNTALARQFADVSASLGRDKSRVLRASGPLGAPRRWPRRRQLPEVGLTVVAHGNVFGADRLDAGTGLLLRALGAALDDLRRTAEADAPAPGGTAVDLGCGSGILAAWLARRGFAVIGTDVSASAVASTRLTAQANDVGVDVRRADGLAGLADASVDLIVTNPPFHHGTRKDSSPTVAMIRDARRVLRPGGELWTVFNSHLPYLPELRRSVGSTGIEARDRQYLVTRSRRPPR